MAIAFVIDNDNVGTSVSSLTVTNLAAIAVNALLVVFVGIRDATQRIPRISDNAPSGGNTYRLADTIAIPGTGLLAVFYCSNAKAVGNGALTITATADASTDITLGYCHYTGAAVVSPLDKHRTASGNSANASAGSLTPTAAGSLGWAVFYGANTFTVAGAFTTRNVTNDGNGRQGETQDDFPISGATTASVTNSAGVWLAVYVVFSLNNIVVQEGEQPTFAPTVPIRFAGPWKFDPIPRAYAPPPPVTSVPAQFRQILPRHIGPWRWDAIPYAYTPVSTVTVVTATGFVSAEATASASPLGLGSVSGSASSEASPFAAILGVGQLAGNVSAEATDVAAILGVGRLAGDVSAEATDVAAILGVGQLAGDVSAEATDVAAILGVGQLAGDVSAEATTSAALASTGFLAGSASAETTALASLLGAFTLAGASSSEATTRASVIGVGVLSGATSAEATAKTAIAGAGTLAGAAAAEASSSAALLGVGYLTLLEASEATASAQAIQSLKQALGIGEAVTVAQIVALGTLAGAGIGETVTPRAILFAPTIAPSYGGAGVGAGKVRQWEGVDQTLYDVMTKLLERQTEVWKEQIRLDNLERLKQQTERDRHYKAQLDRAAAILARATGQATQAHPADEVPAVAASLLAVLKVADTILKKFS
jgi:hypothetical protein